MKHLLPILISVTWIPFINEEAQPRFTLPSGRGIKPSSLATGAIVLAVLWFNPGVGAAQAQSPPTGLISMNRFGNGSGNQPALNNALSFSADGRYVAFVS